nr:putative athila retroelement ORF1 protein [Tanacetum cinerariifolium]
MADNRTMAQMLQAPIEGYEDAIVVPPINANNFELKQTLINLVQSNKFTERQDPHNHLRFFNKVTSTKSKVRYSRSIVTDVRANANAPLSSSSHSNSFDLQQIAAALEDKLNIRMNRFEKSLNEMKNYFVTPTVPLKAVTELPTDQTIAIINVHSLEAEMIFPYFMITSNSFKLQQSEISFRIVRMFLIRHVHVDFISLLSRITTKIVFKAIISIKTVNQTKELSIRTVHHKTLIFKLFHNKTRLRKANSKPTPQQTTLT